MSPAIIEILVLAGIAIFLVLRLKNVLGTREGFEKPPLQDAPSANNNRDFRVIEGGEDTDITDNCLLYTSPSPRDRQKSRMPSSA